MSRAKQLVTEGMWLEMQRLTMCLDGRVEGVELPDPLRGLPTVTLIYTEEIYIGDIGVRATLSFEGDEVDTFVPWEALYQVASDIGHVMFVDSVPLDDILQRQEALQAAEEEPAVPAVRERPAWLSLVP